MDGRTLTGTRLSASHRSACSETGESGTTRSFLLNRNESLGRSFQRDGMTTSRSATGGPIGVPRPSGMTSPGGHPGSSRVLLGGLADPDLEALASRNASAGSTASRMPLSPKGTTALCEMRSHETDSEQPRQAPKAISDKQHPAADGQRRHVRTAVGGAPPSRPVSWRTRLCFGRATRMVLRWWWRHPRPGLQTTPHVLHRSR